MTIAIFLRRMSTALAVLGLAVLGLSATASAAPTFTFKTKALPIPGFPGTGDILGAGAVIQVQGRISGTEYGGFPPPLTGIKYYAPAGAKLHPQGFATCAPSTIEQSGPGPCPKNIDRGPEGQRDRRRELRQRTRAGDGVGTAVLRPRWQPGVLRGRHDAGLARNPRDGPRRGLLSAFRSGGHWRSAADRNGAGSARRVVRGRHHQCRRRVQAGQEDDLLRHGAEEVPEGRHGR